MSNKNNHSYYGNNYYGYSANNDANNQFYGAPAAAAVSGVNHQPPLPQPPTVGHQQQPPPPPFQHQPTGTPAYGNRNLTYGGSGPPRNNGGPVAAAAAPANGQMPPPTDNNNYYQRRRYYGQNKGQYRAQVIDYTNGSSNQSATTGNYTGNTHNSSMTRPPSGLLPHPETTNLQPFHNSHQQSYDNSSKTSQLTGQPTQTSQPMSDYSDQSSASLSSSYYSRGPPSQPVQPPIQPPLPSTSYPAQPPPPPPLSSSTSHQSQATGQQSHVRTPSPQMMTSYANQSTSQYGSAHYGRAPPPPPPSGQPPLPMQPPPPVPPPPSYPPPPVEVVDLGSPSRGESNESRIDKLKAEGIESRQQNELKGYWCLICEVFCQNFNNAERHIESPKHHKTKIGDTLKGIDAKYTIKTDNISNISVALARKKELSKISNVIKNDYFNEGIRLKDGIGKEAYICENCGVSIESLQEVVKHLELHKLFAQQLKICSKPIIGLDFINEFIDPNPNRPRIYECVMCHTFNTTSGIITHICSFNHRTNFIKRIHPSEASDFREETPQSTLEAGKRALELETLVGRGEYRVINQAAPPNCLAGNVLFTYGTDRPPKQTATSSSSSVAVEPQQSSSVTKTYSQQINMPSKSKSVADMSPLERVFRVRLTSERDVVLVTEMITDITKSVMEYQMRQMSPELKHQIRQQIGDNNNINTTPKKTLSSFK
ncbi:uncharacterized protein LOC128951449 [Oppia nitens]|uniref:uncharacterized protein LOC128951449 n=1 Tax=Oppia nitens TaxID=1686743 RepID=UPI0023DACCE3|nr:uncharacterized protein LOC128951449 [Oppia nitens]